MIVAQKIASNKRQRGDRLGERHVPPNWDAHNKRTCQRTEWRYNSACV